MKVYITDQLPNFVTTKLEKNGLEVINNSEIEISKEIAEVDFLISSVATKIDRNLIDQAPKLKLIANFGAGFDNIDVDYANTKGIAVTNTPGVSTTSVAEVTIGLMLTLAHRIVEGDKFVRNGNFNGWKPLAFLGSQLAGKNLGIIGFGQIGIAVNNFAQNFSMNINYWQPRKLTTEQERVLNVSHQDFDHLVSESDFVVILAPLTSDNYHQFNRTVFNKMKKTAFLINAARGPIVNEKDLVQALEKREIAGAALDVFEHEPSFEEPLKNMDNVILTPHLASATIEARDAMGELVVDNIMNFIRDKKITTVN